MSLNIPKDINIDTLSKEEQNIYLRCGAANALALIEIAYNLQVLQSRGLKLPFGDVKNTYIQAALSAAQNELGVFFKKHDDFQIVQ